MTEQEFEQFYKAHYRGFYAFAYQYIPDMETCRDILADAFEALWLRQDAMPESERRSLAFAIIRNKCIDHLRREETHDDYARQTLLQSDLVDESDDITSVVYHQQVRVFREVFRALTPRTREVFAQCYLQQRTYQQVAESLDISVSAVKKHVMQALAQFRETMAKNKRP